MPETTPSQPAPGSSEESAIGLPIHRPEQPALETRETLAPVNGPTSSTELVTQRPPKPEPEPERDRTVFMPPIDIYDSGEGLVLLADLPGVTIESLEIQVQDNRLTLYGRVTPTLPVEARLLHQEFEWGDFLRSFILSDEVDHDQITAKLTNGVLEVVLPRTPKAEPRRIQVNRE